jgi:thioesterase domain-containing protein/aryl carrier-like protein
VRLEPSPYEELLCDTFAELLKARRVDAEDDFFSLGGHSMLAVKLQRRLRATLGVKLTVQDLFRNPTPRGLAARLHRQGEETLTEPLLAIRATGGSRPLFCVHPILGLSWGYSALLRHLSTDQPVYGLQATGTATGPGSLDELAAEYLARIRTIQPDGPYRLAGFSLGGVIAHAMATALQREGAAVSTLALIDSYPRQNVTGDRDAAVLGALLDSVTTGPDRPDGPDRTGPADRATVMAALHEATGLSDTAELIDAAVRNDRLTRELTPGEFDGDLLFFSAVRQRPAGLTAHLWEPTVTGTVREHEVQAGHHQMLRAPAIDVVGPVLASWLGTEPDRACPGGSRQSPAA